MLLSWNYVCLGVASSKVWNKMEFGKKMRFDRTANIQSPIAEGYQSLKGVWHEIFDFSFFYESVSPGPLSIPLGSFRLFSKIRRDDHESMFISGVNDCSTVSTTPLTNLSVVSLTPAINLCQGFSLIGGVIDTGDKFIIGVVDTAEKWSPMTTTPMINFSLVSMTPMNNYHWWQQHWR